MCQVLEKSKKACDDWKIPGTIEGNINFSKYITQYCANLISFIFFNLFVSVLQILFPTGFLEVVRCDCILQYALAATFKNTFYLQMCSFSGTHAFTCSHAGSRQ